MARAASTTAHRAAIVFPLQPAGEPRDQRRGDDASRTFHHGQAADACQTMRAGPTSVPAERPQLRGLQGSPLRPSAAPSHGAVQSPAGRAKRVSALRRAQTCHRNLRGWRSVLGHRFERALHSRKRGNPRGRCGRPTGRRPAGPRDWRRAGRSKLDGVGPASVVLRVRGVRAGDRKRGHTIARGLVVGAIETSPMRSPHRPA